MFIHSWLTQRVSGLIMPETWVNRNLGEERTNRWHKYRYLFTV